MILDGRLLREICFLDIVRPEKGKKIEKCLSGVRSKARISRKEDKSLSIIIYNFI